MKQVPISCNTDAGTHEGLWQEVIAGNIIRQFSTRVDGQLFFRICTQSLKELLHQYFA